MIKVATDFSGIGSPEQAIKNLKIEHEVVFACDIDKFAKQTYLANHRCNKFYDDITTRKHKEVEQLDLYIAGFPCQAFSIAGKRRGFDDIRGTLFYNVAEFIKINQPKTFILENVKGLLSHDNGKTFQTIIDLLSNCGGTTNGQMAMDFFEDGLGYHIYYKVLNTKEHGIPQNRERIFITGFKDYRSYNFPKKQQLKLRLSDLLQNEVDDKFYLSNKAVKSIILNPDNLQKSKVNPDVANALQTPGHSCGVYKGMTAVTQINQSKESGGQQPYQQNRVYDDNGISPALMKGKSDLLIKSNTKKGFEEAKIGDSVNYSNSNSKTRRGRVGKQVAQTLDTGCSQGVLIGASRGRDNGNGKNEQNLEINNNGVSNSLTSVQKDNLVITDKIRRLTPLECFRLQGFPDSFKKVVSDTQLYKQAGNSITVNVIQKVIENIYKH